MEYTEQKQTLKENDDLSVSLSEINRKKVNRSLKTVFVIFSAIIVLIVTFIVSIGVSSSKSIAPNAPESRPKAYEPTESLSITPIIIPLTDFDPKGTIDCSSFPDTLPYGNRCVPVIKDSSGTTTWAPGAIEALTK